MAQEQQASIRARFPRKMYIGVWMTFQVNQGYQAKIPHHGYQIDGREDHKQQGLQFWMIYKSCEDGFRCPGVVDASPVEVGIAKT
jgi:hypothetical protein